MLESKDHLSVYQLPKNVLQELDDLCIAYGVFGYTGFTLVNQLEK
jgi:hypothetical protein